MNREQYNEMLERCLSQREIDATALSLKRRTPKLGSTFQRMSVEQCTKAATRMNLGFYLAHRGVWDRIVDTEVPLVRQ